MSESTKILVRNAREQDIPAVAEIEAEASSPTGTTEKLETFQRRLTTFPNGFVILVAENEIAAYGSSEKRLTEHEPGQDKALQASHEPDGKVFYISGLAVKRKFQGRGYRFLVLDKLIETAHLEGCKKVVLETSRDQDLYRERGFTTVQNRRVRGVSMDVMSLDLKDISIR